MAHFKHNRIWFAFLLLVAMSVNMVTPAFAAGCASLSASPVYVGTRETVSCKMKTGHASCCCAGSMHTNVTAHSAPLGAITAPAHSCDCTIDAPAPDESAALLATYFPGFFLAMALLPADAVGLPVKDAELAIIAYSDQTPPTLFASTTPSRAPPAS